MVAPVTNEPTTLKLMHTKGQVAPFCVDADRSRFVQQAIEVATPQEIIMAYEEIMPCVSTLAVKAFGNHTVQKIVEHGPQSCKRELIRHLIGHVLRLSLHMYSCRVIQKALEVGELDQKIVIAKELQHKVLKCGHDQLATHGIQKHLDVLPPNHIKFIFQSFCGRVKVISTHPYSSTEIMMVRKFERRVVSMCYHKFAPRVLENCLPFGSHEDRQLITNEIIDDVGDQQFHHVMDMMINPYGNFVIQKMVVKAEEQQGHGPAAGRGQKERSPPDEVPACMACSSSSSPWRGSSAPPS